MTGRGTCACTKYKIQTCERKYKLKINTDLWRAEAQVHVAHINSAPIASEHKQERKIRIWIGIPTKAPKKDSLFDVLLVQFNITGCLWKQNMYHAENLFVKVDHFEPSFSNSALCLRDGPAYKSLNKIQKKTWTNKAGTDERNIVVVFPSWFRLNWFRCQKVFLPKITIGTTKLFVKRSQLKIIGAN